MKKIAIFKIVFFSIIIVILSAILVYGIFRKSSGFSFGFTNFHYSNAKAYAIAKDEMNLEINGINQLEVHWIGGSVSITKSDDNQIHFYELCDDEVRENENNLMRYLIKDNKLIIQFCKSTWFVKHKIQNGKELIIQLPSEAFSEVEIDAISANIVYKDINLSSTGFLKIDVVSGNSLISNANLTTLKIDNVSGTINLDSLHCLQKISVDTVSGSVNLNQIFTNDFNVDTVSGDVYTTGNINAIDLESVSGNAKLILDNLPSKIECDTVSGNVTITIPDNDGFKASFDSVSGVLSTNFASVISKKEIIYKNGIVNYFFESVSGDVRIDMKND